MIGNFSEKNIANETELHKQASAIQIQVLKRARERGLIDNQGLLNWTLDKTGTMSVRKWIETHLSLDNYVSEEEMIEHCLRIFFYQS